MSRKVSFQEVLLFGTLITDLEGASTNRIYSLSTCYVAFQLSSKGVISGCNKSLNSRTCGNGLAAQKILSGLVTTKTFAT